MEAFLQLKECWAAVLGTEQNAAKQAKALAYIKLGVGDSFMNMLRSDTTAKDAWDRLKEMFQSRTIARKLKLRKELLALKMGASESVDDYLLRAEAIGVQMQNAGMTITDEEIVLPALAGLPAEYNTIVQILEQSDDNLTLSNVRAKVLLAEQRVVESPPIMPGTEKAMNTTISGSQPRAKGQHKGKQKKQFDKECWNCGKVGHLARDCWSKPKRPSAPPSRGQHTAYAAEDGDAVALAANGARDSPGPGLHWILDSGASQHITSTTNGMENVRALKAEADCKVLFANGHHEKVPAVGDVRLSGQGMLRTLLLRDVLVVPGAAANLLSIPAAAKRGATFKFEDGRAEIHYNNVKVATAHKSADGVYTIGGQSTIHAAAVVPAAQLWHRRLGHIGAPSLQKMVQTGMVDGLGLSLEHAKTVNEEVCEPCLQAKQTRSPFPESTSTTTRPMELVHMDVMGPMPVHSLGGKRYLATFMDDYSKLSMVRPLASKADVAAASKEVLEFLSNQSSCKLKAVRTDNGTEYVNQELRSYFKSKGVEHQMTVPYTPEQNGKAERLNRTLMDKVRAMLHEAKLRKSLWAEAVNTASYLRNRSAVSGKDQTPWELFYKKKPDVSHLRVFGARAHMHVPKEHRDKLDPRSLQGVMVGSGHQVRAGESYFLMAESSSAEMWSSRSTYRHLWNSFQKKSWSLS